MDRYHSKFDVATLVGLIFGVIVVTAAMTAMAGVGTYWNLPGLLIVCGGTLAAVLIKFPMRTSLKAFSDGLFTSFRDRTEHPHNLIRTATHLATVMRTKGPLALEMVMVKNPFYKRGAQLMADGHGLPFLLKTLNTEMNLSLERTQMSERVYRAIGDSAPGFGMIGTLVGLVQMLAHMEDPTQIGLGMAVALLTTLYGAIIANLFANPIADKLQMRAHREYRNNSLILDSFVQIFEKQSPRVIEDMLEPYLSVVPPSPEEKAGRFYKRRRARHRHDHEPS
ncbi:MAG: MotA/TolQ/ExbB proton channel family protein [Gammaproteobacteria bacterium]|nr:MotA/TolQ/ExbB proton channel family protein [Gammaproteobacteria bacterium]MDH5692860.1 MotA/TolQ/ExbB proton channel family protein [Gammaproteobacteria bacterium]